VNMTSANDARHALDYRQIVSDQLAALDLTVERIEATCQWHVANGDMEYVRPYAEIHAAMAAIELTVIAMSRAFSRLEDIARVTD
jgi:hypothetical protein